MLLFVVGYMGCGKSSLGRRLAKRLGYAFVDTDKRVEEIEGAEVGDIFLYEGEEHFRNMERKVLEGVIAAGENAVVSTGGGLPIWRDNMATMNAAGVTLYLRRPAEQIARRLTPYGRWKRPKLRGLNDQQLVEFMTRNMSEREPFYAQSKITLEGAGLDDDALIEQLLSKLRRIV